MILITHEKLLVEDIVSETRGDDKGGVVTFLGTIRDTTDNHRVLYLEYEAYGPMAEKLLKEQGLDITKAKFWQSGFDYNFSVWTERVSESILARQAISGCESGKMV